MESVQVVGGKYLSTGLHFCLVTSRNPGLNRNGSIMHLKFESACPNDERHVKQ
jgi:hypothetical protein